MIGSNILFLNYVDMFLLFKLFKISIFVCFKMLICFLSWLVEIVFFNVFIKFGIKV